MHGGSLCGVAAARHRIEQPLDGVEPPDPSGEIGEGVAARLEELECGAVGSGVDAERADDRQLLVYDMVGIEAWCGGIAAGPGQDDGAAWSGEGDGLAESLRRLGGDVDDDVGEEGQQG